MLLSARRLFVAVSLAAIFIAATGCGSPENQVIEFTPDTQAEFDAYNKTMDEATPRL